MVKNLTKRERAEEERDNVGKYGGSDPALARQYGSVYTKEGQVPERRAVDRRQLHHHDGDVLRVRLLHRPIEVPRGGIRTPPPPLTISLRLTFQHK